MELKIVIVTLNPHLYLELIDLNMKGGPRIFGVGHCFSLIERQVRGSPSDYNSKHKHVLTSTHKHIHTHSQAHTHKRNYVCNSYLITFAGARQ